MARQRLTVQAAAETLGVSVDAVRSRIRRGSLESEKDPDGRVYVWLGSDQSIDEPQRQVEGSRELIEVLRAQVEDLRARLDRETEANRENRRIIAGLIERVPELEAPSSATEPREGDLSASEEGTASTPAEDRPGPEASAQRPWWRRLIGGASRG